jgi:iron complex transport system permease protein
VKRGSHSRWFVICSLLLGVLALTSLATGSLTVPLATIGRVLLDRSGLWPAAAGTLAETDSAVVWSLRLPRVILAILAGGGLGLAGACLQGLFRNPLADPGLIGISGGAAAGAVLAIAGGALLGSRGLSPTWGIPLAALAGGWLATWLVYRIAGIGGRTHTTTLLLAGLAMNALCGALTGLVLYLSTSEQLRQFTFWTLGSLGNAGWHELRWAVPLIVVPGIALMGYRRALNAFLLGEAEAYTLGIATQRLKRACIAWTALLVGTIVAHCGLIGFVGLMVPHWVRLMTGPDHRPLLPLAAIAGACLMLAADLVARTVNAPAELPIGILTALLGAPYFLFLVWQRKRSLGA